MTELEELREQNAGLRRSMLDASVLLDRAYRPSGERLELRIAQLIRIEKKLRAALKQIDRHVVGACVSDEDFTMPEPCEECGEMREIAAQALGKEGTP